MEQTNTTPPAQAPMKARERLAAYQAKYGMLSGLWTFLRGEKPPKISEHETPTPAYAQMLVYTASIANVFLFGYSEMLAIIHYGIQPISILLAVPLLVVLQLVYAMNRSVVKTMPRIPLLAARRQMPLLIEHIAYVFCVLALEATTLMYVAYLVENAINLLLSGKQLIPGGFIGIVALLVVRGILYGWTIPHAELIKEQLSVTWGTLERKMTELLGGSLLVDVTQIDATQLPPEVKLATLNKMMTPPQRAPWQWNRRKRREQQEALNLAHRTEVVAEFNTLTKGATGLQPGQKALTQAEMESMLSPVLAKLESFAELPTLTHVHEVTEQKSAAILALIQQNMTAWGETLQRQFGEQIAAMQEQIAVLAQGQEQGEAFPAFSNQQQKRSSGVKTPPKPGTRQFNEAVYRIAHQMVQQDDQVTFFTVAAKAKQELGAECSADDVKTIFTARRSAQVQSLRPGKELAPDPVLDALF